MIFYCISWAQNGFGEQLKHFDSKGWDGSAGSVSNSFSISQPFSVVRITSQNPDIWPPHSPLGSRLRMFLAERTHWWIERWLECRAIYLSINRSILSYPILSKLSNPSNLSNPSIYLSNRPIYLSNLSNLSDLSDLSDLSNLSNLSNISYPILFMYPSICIYIYIYIYIHIRTITMVRHPCTPALWQLSAAERTHLSMLLSAIIDDADATAGGWMGWLMQWLIMVSNG